MTPDTIHLLAQTIRHHRAMVTSFEKWVRKQPRSETCRELVQVIAVARGILDQYEQQLSQYVVDQPVTNGSEVTQPSCDQVACSPPCVEREAIGVSR